MPVQPAKNSYLPLIIGGSVLGAVVIVVILIAALAPTRTTQQPQQNTFATAKTNTNPVPIQNSSNSDRAVQNSKAFFNDYGGRVENLEKARKAVSDANATIAERCGPEIKAQKQLAEDLARKEEALAKEFAAQRDKEIEVNKNIKAKQASLDALNSAQKPLSAYLSAYASYAEAMDSQNTLQTEMNAADAATSTARTAYLDQKEKVADVESIANASMDVDERTAAQMVLDSSRAKLTELRTTLESAEESQALAASRYSRATLDVGEFGEKLGELRLKLDAKDPETAKLLIVIEKYETVLLGKLKAVKALNEAKKKQQDSDRESAVPIGDFKAAKEAYLQAHGAYLEAKKQTSKLEEQYKSDQIRGEWAKEAIRRAQAVEDGLKPADEEAKKKLNEISKRMNEAAQKDKATIKEILTAQKGVQEAIDKIAPARKELANAVVAARKALGPEEAARLKEVEKAIEELKKLREGLGILKDEYQRKQSELERVARDRQEAESNAANAESAATNERANEVLKAFDAALEKFKSLKDTVLTPTSAREIGASFEALEAKLEQAVEDDSLSVSSPDQKISASQSTRRGAIMSARKYVKAVAEGCKALEVELSRN
jgi:chromosome segregation ATPase